jgi:hypothetical protein
MGTEPHTDGQPAVAVAYEEGFTKPQGMRFTFPDRCSRELFWRRVSQCLDRGTRDALVTSPLGSVDNIDTRSGDLHDPGLARRRTSLGLGEGG